MTQTTTPVPTSLLVICCLLLALLLGLGSGYFVFSGNNNEPILKGIIAERDQENAELNEQITQDSALIEQLRLDIKYYETAEKNAKAQTPKIILKYEKAKADYISQPLNERRRIFAELANE